MFNKLLLPIIVVVFIVGFWSLRSHRKTAAGPALVVQRIEPVAPVLRGQPNDQVNVRLEVSNPTNTIVELQPLKLSCSCQLEKGPDLLIPPNGKTEVALKLRYPPGARTSVPVEFRSVAGDSLARMDVVLESDRSVPYFEFLPTEIQIPVIEGVSSEDFDFSVATVEATNSEPFISDCHVILGQDLVGVSHRMIERSSHGVECQRTYQLTFHLKDEIWSLLGNEQTALRGEIAIDLADGTRKEIPWSVKSQPPVSLFFDSQTRTVRGVRRGGATGNVSLRCLPEGTLSQSDFAATESIIAKVAAETATPLRIEATYEGHSGPVLCSLRIPGP